MLQVIEKCKLFLRCRLFFLLNCDDSYLANNSKVLLLLWKCSISLKNWFKVV